MIEVEELKELPQLTREIAVEMRLIPRTKRAEDPAVDPENPAQGTEEDEADEDRFEISISSEAEVPRWFGTEILDHSTSSVDLSRAAERTRSSRRSRHGRPSRDRPGHCARSGSETSRGSFASRVRLAPRILSATCRTESVRLFPSAIA